ncbi:hypothetical protein B0H16DRAFT_1439476 [Mycena metata]|uniref:Protein kinase domain-containing protein n=1 Tax=Mycena metata TaxID=1033252 RepID=A0AAD7GUN5_9AGAR|nr:hypothetical protein B0H16DRAFT_1439476 [Mycena metata]
MSLEAALHTVLAEVPAPGLSSAFKLLTFILSSVQAARESKKQLETLAQDITQLLRTLNVEFKEFRIIAANCVKPLADLESLLQDIHRFVQKEREKHFLKLLLTKDLRIGQIESFYRRIGLTVGTFQISSIVSVQDMLRNNATAQVDDAEILHARLKGLEQNQDDLRNVLQINHNSMLAMMAALQRRINVAPTTDQEQNFYSHTLQYLTSISGQQVQLKDWMIAFYDVEFGPEIGVGGFGKVFHGTWNRTEVAIKVLHNVAGIKADVELLRKEIDLWLTLRHPNIIMFLGANTLDDSPFVVMPYIPFNARQFLVQHPAFNPVYILRDTSLALQYLHSRKICHGDLKGVNILVERSGRALLCDFGLSRMKADATSRTAHTGNTRIAGSRNWMAPELLAGSLPKIPSDVYAFGMTLFELYTDELPLANIDHTDFIELVFRLGVRPTRPDTDDVPKLTDSLWTLAEKCWLQDAKSRPTAGQIHALITDVIRETSAESPEEHLRKMPEGLSGTLNTDHLEMPSASAKATEVPPQTVGQLEVVTKSKGDLGDNLLSMGNLEGSLLDYKKKEQLSSEVSWGQKGVLGVDHPHTPQSKTAEVPPSAVGRKTTEELQLEDVQKSTGADTLHSMSNLARTYNKLGKWKEAEELWLDLLNRQKRVCGLNHPDTLRSMANLAQARIKLGGTRWHDAQELCVHVILTGKQILGVDDPDVLYSMSNLAYIYNHSDFHTVARRLGLDVVERQKHVLGVDHPDTLLSMFNLVDSHKLCQTWDTAEKLGLDLIRRQKDVLGVDDANTLLSMCNLADTYNKLKKWREAEQLGLEVVRRQQQVLGVGHTDTVYSMSILAITYQNLEKWKEAEDILQHLSHLTSNIGLEKATKLWYDIIDMWSHRTRNPSNLHFLSHLAYIYTELCGQWKIWLIRDVLDTQKAVLGVHHPDSLCSTSRLAYIYNRAGHWQAAEVLCLDLIKGGKQVLKVDHEDMLYCTSNLAYSYLYLGKWKEAEELGLDVVQRQKRVQGVDHRNTLFSMSNLADTYNKLGKWKEAQELGLEVVKRQEQVFGAEHLNTLHSMSSLASTYRSLGKGKEAEETLQHLFHLTFNYIKSKAHWEDFKPLWSIIQQWKHMLGVGDPDMLRSLSNLIPTFSQYTDTQELALDVFERQKRVLGVDHPDTLLSMFNLAAIGFDHEKKEQLNLEVLQGRKRVLGVDHKDTLLSMSRLAHFYMSLLKYKEAAELFLDLYKIQSRVLGVDHKDSMWSMHYLAQVYERSGKWGEAEVLSVELLQIQEQFLGVDHIDTYYSRDQLLRIYEGLGKHEEAGKLKKTIEDGWTRRRDL